MTYNTLLKTRKYRLKAYADCFIGKLKNPLNNNDKASEAVNYIFEWEQDFIELKTEESVIDTLQLLIDIHAVQHIIDPEKKFTNSSSLYRFTIPFHNPDMRELFISTVTDNFHQFKLVQSFISNRNNVESLYNSMVSSFEGFELTTQKHKNKMVDNVFLGYEAVIWMKDKFKLEDYGAILLGECMRQIKAFEPLKQGSKFQNGQVYYVMSSDKKFQAALRLIYENSGTISKQKNGKSLLEQIIELIANLMNYGNSNTERDDEVQVIEEIDEK